MHSVDPVEKLQGLLNPVGDEEAGAAVAVLLKRAGGGLQVLLVKRATSPIDPWSGDMAFPGGRRRLEDRGLKETVIRETMEETGIDLRRCRFLGTLGVVASTVAPELGVLPFVVLCGETPVVTLSEELSSYFWVPFEQLKQSRGMAWVDRGEVPAYLVGGEVVWGLTYRMLENLLQLTEKTTCREAGSPG